METLLEEAYRCGRLDLILTRPLRDPETESATSEAPSDSAMAHRTSQEGLDYLEFQRIDSSKPKKESKQERKLEVAPALREEEEKKESEEKGPKAHEEPDWLRDLDRKISKTISF